jgi:hypothetical protein
VELIGYDDRLLVDYVERETGHEYSARNPPIALDRTGDAV